jgi:protein-S-isoprenylcysteine O-methyltransferase Ste14
MMLRFLAGLTVQMAVFTALVMVPAWALTGGLDWRRGWLAVSIAFAASAIGGLWLLKTDPGLVRERTSIPRPQTRADGLATLLIGLSVIGWFVGTAWDVHRLHLVELPRAVSLWVGLAIFLIGLGVLLWTFRVNTFAAPVVKIQGERHQRVIDKGPYALVRHPMFMGAILVLAGFGLILGSTIAALVALPLFVIGFLPRMVIEEATLRRDLAGYADYESRVRSRILPGVF